MPAPKLSLPLLDSWHTKDKPLAQDLRLEVRLLQTMTEQKAY